MRGTSAISGLNRPGSARGSNANSLSSSRVVKPSPSGSLFPGSRFSSAFRSCGNRRRGQAFRPPARPVSACEDFGFAAVTTPRSMCAGAGVGTSDTAPNPTTHAAIRARRPLVDCNIPSLVFLVRGPRPVVRDATQPPASYGDFVPGGADSPHRRRRLTASNS